MYIYIYMNMYIYEYVYIYIYIYIYTYVLHEVRASKLFKPDRKRSRTAGKAHAKENAVYPSPETLKQ